MKILTLTIVAISMGACTQLPKSSSEVTRMESDSELILDSNEAGFIEKNQGLLVDSASTTLGMTLGFAEANPLLTGACGTDPIAVGLCTLGAKKLLEKGIESALGEKHSSEVTKYTNTASYLAGCSNIALITGVAFPANLVLGGICAGFYWDAETRKTAALKRPALPSEIAESSN